MTFITHVAYFCVTYLLPITLTRITCSLFNLSTSNGFRLISKQCTRNSFIQRSFHRYNTVFIQRINTFVIILRHSSQSKNSSRSRSLYSTILMCVNLLQESIYQVFSCSSLSIYFISMSKLEIVYFKILINNTQNITVTSNDSSISQSNNNLLFNWLNMFTNNCRRFRSFLNLIREINISFLSYCAIRHSNIHLFTCYTYIQRVSIYCISSSFNKSLILIEQSNITNS